MGGYFDVWAVWLDGKPTSGLVLWGWQVLWWGRAGKVLLFLAGLIAVVDVIKHSWLGDLGSSLLDRARRASARGNERAALRRIMGLRDRIKADFVLDTGVATTAWTAVHWSQPVAQPPTSVRTELALTVEEYRDHHRRAIDQVEHEHTCTDSHDSLCREQRAYLDRVIDGLLPPEDRALLDRIEAEEAVSPGPSIVSILGGVLAASVGFVVLLAGVAQANALLLLISGGITAVVAVLMFPRLQLWVAPGLHRLRSWVARGLGVQLEASQPLRSLRLLALFVFVAGAHFDLLAS